MRTLTFSILAALLLAACEPPQLNAASRSSADRFERCPIMSRVSDEIRHRRAWSSDAQGPRLKYHRIVYRVLPLPDGRWRLTATLPPGEIGPVRTGEAIGVVLRAAAREHDVGAEFARLASALRERRRLDPIEINGVLVWVDGAEVNALPVASKGGCTLPIPSLATL